MSFYLKIVHNYEWPCLAYTLDNGHILIIIECKSSPRLGLSKSMSRLKLVSNIVSLQHVVLIES